MTCLLLLALGAPPTALGQEWNLVVTSRGNPAQTGEFAGPGPTGPPAEVWRFNTSGPCPGGTCGGGYVEPPVIAEAVAYVASADGLAAIHARSGQLLWRTVATGGLSDATVVDGLVIAGGADFTSGRNVVMAFEAGTGLLVWELPVAGRPIGITVGEGLLFVGTANPPGSRIGALYAIDPTTGDDVWHVEAEGQFNRPAYASGRVIVGNSAGTLRAFSPSDGAPLWTTMLGGFVLSPAMTDQFAYVGSDERLYAVDAATGEVRWTFDTGAYTALATVAAGRVFVSGSGDRTLDALDAVTGRPLWAATADEELGQSSVAQGAVYVGSGQGTVYAIDAATGAGHWELSLGRSLATTSPVIGNGLVYFGPGSGGELIAIGEAAS